MLIMDGVFNRTDVVLQNAVRPPAGSGPTTGWQWLLEDLPPLAVFRQSVGRSNVVVVQ